MSDNSFGARGQLTVDDVDGTTALLTLGTMAAGELISRVAAHGPALEIARVRQPLSDIFREVTR